MPVFPAKEIKKHVMACSCPDMHKTQLEDTLNSMSALGSGKILQVIQTLEAWAVKYGPQIWADAQALLALFGGTTPPAPAPGPTPAQVTAKPGMILTPAAASRQGSISVLALMVLCAFAVIALLLVGSPAKAAQLAVSQLPLPQNMMEATDCPCGLDCPCGPNCLCGKHQDMGEVYAALDAGESEDLPPPLPNAPVAAAAPVQTFHIETRCVGTGVFRRCIQVCVPDTLPQSMLSAATATYAAPATATYSYQVPVQSYKTVQVPVTTYRTVQVPTTSYQTVQVPTTSYQTVTATACADCGSGGMEATAYGVVFAAHKGMIQRIRERRAARHAGRVAAAYGGTMTAVCSTCGG